MHPNVERVVRALAEAGATGRPIELPEPAPTAAAAAAQLGCPVGAIANSLVFSADDEPLLVLTSGAHRVDTKVVAELVEAAEVDRAKPDFVRAHAGFPIGGVAPVAHARPMRTLVDRWLADYPTVWAAAGHPRWVFPTTFDELLRISGGVAADVGE